MGGLLGMLGGLASGGGANQEQHSGIANALLEHIQGSGGGLGGILQGFHNAGLGNKVNSWVSTGQNESVSPDEVEQGLGSGTVNDIASRAGVSSGVAKTALAAILPMVVDHLTPGGQVPQGGMLSGLIGKLMGRAA